MKAALITVKPFPTLVYEQIGIAMFKMNAVLLSLRKKIIHTHSIINKCNLYKLKGIMNSYNMLLLCVKVQIFGII